MNKKEIDSYIIEIVSINKTKFEARYFDTYDNRIGRGPMNRRSFNKEQQKVYDILKIGDYVRMDVYSENVILLKKMSKSIFRPFRKLEIKTKKITA